VGDRKEDLRSGDRELAFGSLLVFIVPELESQWSTTGGTAILRRKGREASLRSAMVRGDLIRGVRAASRSRHRVH
jgi:hypothetical protein